MTFSPRPVAATLRLYRAMADAFPYEFKSAYGAEVLQLTEDIVEPIWRRHGILGLLRLLADVAIRVVVEHLALLWHDIHYGIRMLTRSPGFTAVALISLSVGICIATCADSEMNGIILRNLPMVTNPNQLQRASPTPFWKTLPQADLWGTNLTAALRRFDDYPSKRLL